MPNLYAVRSRRLRIGLALAAFTFAVSFGHAAESAEGLGSILGRVISLDTGGNVSGAFITVTGTPLTATTDLNGAYTISSVPPGTHSLLVVREGFQNSIVNSVRVQPGSATRVDVPMEVFISVANDDLVEMAEFVISADLLEGSDLALLGDRQKSAAVSDAIGEDTFSRLSLGSAGEIVGKSVGSTIVDGKYAVIRGLGDRYTNTLLNNVSMPSADPDKRAVQLDQFPSSLLESVVVSKSFTPDQPGAFSGGSVNLRTKSFPERFFFSAGTKIEFRDGVTGEDLLHVPGGGNDWRARDDRTRALPANLPDPIPANLILSSVNLAARQGNFGPADELDAIARSFKNDGFYPTRRKAGPDYGFNVAFGDRLSLPGDQKLGYVFSLNFDTEVSGYAGGITGRYSQGSTSITDPNFVDVYRVFTTNVDEYNFAPLLAANPNTPLGMPEFGVQQSSERVEWGAYGQIAYQPSFNHEVSLRVLHNQSAEDRVRKGVGEAVRSDSGGEFRENYDLLYTERAIRSVQLQGKSLFPALGNATLEWRAARSRSEQDQPDYKNWEFKWSFLLQAYDPSGIINNRYFRALEETADEFGADLTLPLLGNSPRPLTLKVGGQYAATERFNRERAFAIENAAVNGATIPNYPGPVGLQEKETNRVVFGSYPREIAANLNYDGTLDISAGYAMADWTISPRWRMIGGVRAERTELVTTPRLRNAANARVGEIDQTDMLPALSVVFSPREKENIRFAYGRTLARPTFRELADVSNYEAFTDEFIAGNPDLEMTVIDNLDLRWERFLGRGQIIAASAFYKRLENAIELTRDGNDIRPQNVLSGRLFGLEFEARSDLTFLHERLDAVSIGLNATWIDSEVEIPAAELALIRQYDPEAASTRQLFSQSPYIINLDATYEVHSTGTTFTASFNRFGERLDLVASGVLPDVFEQPASGLDCIVTQRLGRRWKLKFTARNLLDPRREKTLEANGSTYLYESYRTGRGFSLSLTYFFE